VLNFDMICPRCFNDGIRPPGDSDDMELYISTPTPLITMVIRGHSAHFYCMVLMQWTTLPAHV
jgi:hypothetical protein